MPAPRKPVRRRRAKASPAGILAGRHALVIGGGITGLAAARVLADRGAAVTLLERDAEQPVDSTREAFLHWKRRGAPQVRHSHAFLGRLHKLLREHYPDLLKALLKAGARPLDMVALPPPALRPLARIPGDEDLVALGVRRTTFEWVVRKQILGSRGIELIAGATVQRLLAEAGDPPLVNGVVCSVAGKERRIEADIVIDASGRTSKAPEWLRAIGARPVQEEQESSGVVYYTRFYRLRPRAKEPIPGKDPTAADYNWVKYAIFPADDRTFSITLAIPLAIPRLKVLAKTAAFDVMVHSIAGLLPWVDPKVSEPIGDLAHPVQAMGGLINRVRRFVDDGGPLAHNLYVLGDAQYCTNPLYGRGCTQGFLHAHLLGESLDAQPDDPMRTALDLDRRAREQIEPFYHASVFADREAVRKAEGHTPKTWLGFARDRFFEEGIVPGLRCDPVIFRAFARMFNMLETPEQAFFRPEIMARALVVMLRGRLLGERWELPPPPDREAVIARCEAAA